MSGDRGGKAESGKQKVEIGRPQMEITEMPETRFDFIMQGAVGEILIRCECPEIAGGKAEG